MPLRSPVGYEVSLVPLLPQRVDAVAQCQQGAVDVGPLHQAGPTVLGHGGAFTACQVYQGELAWGGGGREGRGMGRIRFREGSGGEGRRERGGVRGGGEGNGGVWVFVFVPIL